MSLRTRRIGRQAAAGMLAVTLAMLAFPTDAGAQESESEDGSSGFELMLSVGAFTPLAKLASSGDTLNAEFSTKIAFGAEIDYWFGSFGIGVVGGYSSPSLTIQQVPPDSIGFPLSLEVGTADYFMFTGNVMWRPQLSGSSTMVRPYLGVGAGIVSVAYSQDPQFPTIEDEQRFTVTLLGGAHVTLSKGWFMRLDIRDYISQFNTEPFPDSKTQHDLVTSFMIGYAFH